MHLAGVQHMKFFTQQYSSLTICVFKDHLHHLRKWLVPSSFASSSFLSLKYPSLTPRSFLMLSYAQCDFLLYIKAVSSI